MGIFGWDLPPGCTQRQIDEAFGGNPEAEAFVEAFYEQLPKDLAESEQYAEAIEKISTWAWEQINKAYGEGYQQAKADEAYAKQMIEEDKLANEYWESERKAQENKS